MSDHRQGEAPDATAVPGLYGGGAVATAADASRVTPAALLEKKRLAEPVVMVTAYDVVGGQAARAADIDVVLVGDSAANVVFGYESTRDIKLDELLSLTSAVRRGLDRGDAHHPVPLLVGDLPFGSYEHDDAQAVVTARRFVDEAGCDAVKLEGGGEMEARVRAIVAAGIPVMGHVGLLPQSVSPGEAPRVQGRTADDAVAIAREAMALERAGCFAIVFEAVPAGLAALLSARLTIPVIGIGAGAAVDGQVLVFHDLLGLHRGKRPRFVKQYAGLYHNMVASLSDYAHDVRARAFPAPAHGYPMEEAELARVREALGVETRE